VPKGNGFVNVGLGGKAKYFRSSGLNIHEHFRAFIDDLVREGQLDRATTEDLQESGHPYFLFTREGEVKRDNAFLIGDSAGLASVDLGEGIGPAVESGPHVGAGDPRHRRVSQGRNLNLLLERPPVHWSVSPPMKP
jgi:menaquinone-9 beta-reductase